MSIKASTIPNQFRKSGKLIML